MSGDDDEAAGPRGFSEAARVLQEASARAHVRAGETAVEGLRRRRCDLRRADWRQHRRRRSHVVVTGRGEFRSVPANVVLKGLDHT